ncbi:MAG: hypothetical protein Pars2KO_06330 [Parasphingorhabdus sp.]
MNAVLLIAWSVGDPILTATIQYWLVGFMALQLVVLSAEKACFREKEMLPKLLWLGWLHG